MSRLRRLGNSISVVIPPDEHGLLGRECPETDCKRYFKIGPGTGLKGEGLPCYCPYCGHAAPQDGFWTPEQIDYAKSMAIRSITTALHRDLKAMEFDHKPQGAFGIGVSMRVQSGRPAPIHYYVEKDLETEVICSNCTLRYSVYGVFAFCPDCGQHNSAQILHTNLDVVEKVLGLASGAEKAVADKLIENALEDCVSAFDGFGRELCKVYANRARRAGVAAKVNFENLEGARTALLDVFGIDMSADIAPEDWQAAAMAFQVRHLVAHKMGVVDKDFVARTGDESAIVGRKAAIGPRDIRRVADIIKRVAARLSAELQKLPVRLDER